MSADKTPIAERKRYDFRMGNGEFDELFLTNATIHIERMNTTAFWIGIEPEGMSGLMVNTGVHRGTWYFTLEVDTVGDDHDYQQVQRPRGATVETQKYVRTHIAQQSRITALEAALSASEQRVRVLREALEVAENKLRAHDGLVALKNGIPETTGDALFDEVIRVYPVAEMLQRGWLGSATGFDDLPFLKKSLLRFFEADDLGDLLDANFFQRRGFGRPTFAALAPEKTAHPCVCGHAHRDDGSCTVCCSCIYTPRTPEQGKEPQA